MMKKVYFLLIFSCFQVFFGQNQRFLYDYKFVADSTDAGNMISEIMRLDVLPTGSKYYSQNVFLQDSIMDVRFKKQNGTGETINMDGTPQGIIKHKVYKTYPDFKINLINQIWPDFYNQTDDRKIKWKILPNKEKIGKWDCQKATTYFGGRQWTAWFASSIPIQDGPYKFHGLPGLIIKVSNQNETLVFELKGIHNIQKQNLDEDFEKETNSMPVSYSQYVKLYKNYLKDPIAGLRKVYQEKSFEMRDESGNVIPQAQVLKDYETRAKEAMKKNNNPIELDLLK